MGQSLFFFCPFFGNFFVSKIFYFTFFPLYFFLLVGCCFPHYTLIFFCMYVVRKVSELPQFWSVAPLLHLCCTSVCSTQDESTSSFLVCCTSVAPLLHVCCTSVCSTQVESTSSFGLLHLCCTSVAPLLHLCCTSVAPLLHLCCTSVAPQYMSASGT
jgi:hypothetical protein